MYVQRRLNKGIMTRGKKDDQASRYDVLAAKRGKERDPYKQATQLKGGWLKNSLIKHARG